MKRGLLYLLLVGTLASSPADSDAQDKPSLSKATIVKGKSNLEKDLISDYKNLEKFEYDLKYKLLPFVEFDAGNIIYEKNSLLEFNLDIFNVREYALFHKESDFLYTEKFGDRTFTYELQDGKWIFTDYTGNNENERRSAIGSEMRGEPLVDALGRILEEGVRDSSIFRFFTFGNLYEGKLRSREELNGYQRMMVSKDNLRIFENGRWNYTKNDESVVIGDVIASFKKNVLHFGDIEIKGKGIPFINSKLEIKIKYPLD